MCAQSTQIQGNIVSVTYVGKHRRARTHTHVYLHSYR